MNEKNCGDIMRVKRVYIVAVIFLAVAASAFAQSMSPPPPPDKAPVQSTAPALRVTTRIVQVSVTVHDDNGQPVTGLSKDDFILSDEGKRQKITSFGEQTNSLSTTSANAAPNLFTNRFAVGASQPPLTVIVLDVYNSRWWDIHFCPAPSGPPICAVDPMFHAVEEFVSHMHPQDRVALYELADKLYLLQDFTSDPVALQRALVQGKQYIPTSYSPSQTDPAEMSAHTMDGMHEIADRLARVPGRKNLIWLSSGFPRQKVITEEKMDSSAKTLANADLPLSAINVLGLAGGGATDNIGPVPGRGGGGAGRGATSGADLPTPATGSYNVAGTSGGPVGGFNALRNLAEQSGGSAFYNSNDLSGSIRRVIDNSSATYLLGYYPDHNKWNGEFREIKVKVNRPGVEVRSRSGYYAVADSPSASERDAQKMADAIRSPLESTDLAFDVQVDAVEVSVARQLKAKITLDANQLRFQQQGDRRTDNLAEVWAEFDAEGHEVGRNRKTINLKPTETEHKQLLHDGLSFSETVPVENKAAEVRLVLRDDGNGAIGSVIIPLTKLFPLNNAQGPAKN
jgi:VWFA-related protein